MEKKSTHAPKAPAQTFAKQELLREKQEKVTVETGFTGETGGYISGEAEHSPLRSSTEPISSVSRLVHSEQGRSEAGPSHTTSASPFRPLESANAAPASADGSKKMARSHAVQHTVKRVQAGVEKVKEEMLTCSNLLTLMKRGHAHAQPHSS